MNAPARIERQTRQRELATILHRPATVEARRRAEAELLASVEGLIIGLAAQVAHKVAPALDDLKAQDGRLNSSRMADLIQEGRVTALEMLGRWNPRRGDLAPFLKARVQGAMYNSLSSSVYVDSYDSLTGRGTEFGKPATQLSALIAEEESEALSQVLASLDAEEKRLVEVRFWGERPLSLREARLELGWTSYRAKGVWASVVATMRKAMQE